MHSVVCAGGGFPTICRSSTTRSGTLLHPAPSRSTLQLGGFYVGGNLGAGWSGVGTFSDSAGSTFSSTTNSTFVGGGQFGLNYEFYSGVVIGAEVMFDWAPNTQNTLTISNPGSSATATINSRWLTTVTGKLGYAWDRVLVYGKGGGAWVGADTPSLTTPGGTPISDIWQQLQFRLDRGYWHRVGLRRPLVGAC